MPPTSARLFFCPFTGRGKFPVYCFYARNAGDSHHEKKAADLSDQWPFVFVSLVKVAYISLDISLYNCTISVWGKPL